MPVAAQDVRIAAARFPEQVTGCYVRGGHLYQTVFTPVYLENVPQNVLVAGYGVDAVVAKKLREATGGSEFLFVSGGQPIASSLDPAAARLMASRLPAHATLEPIAAGGIEYAARPTQLLDIEGKPIGDLWILRSFADRRGTAFRAAPQYYSAVAAGGGSQFGTRLTCWRGASSSRSKNWTARPPKSLARITAIA